MKDVTSVLANMSVGRKLRVGFGLVMLLTLVVAATGYFAVNAIQERARQMQHMALIERAVVEAHAAESANQANRDERALQAVRDNLRLAAAESEALARDLDGETGKRIQAIAEAARAFDTRFDTLVENFQAAIDQRQQMEEAAVQARAQAATRNRLQPGQGRPAS